MQKVHAAANPQPSEGLKLRVTPCMHTGIRDFKPEIRTINEEEEEGFITKRQGSENSLEALIDAAGEK